MGTWEPESLRQSSAVQSANLSLPLVDIVAALLKYGQVEHSKTNFDVK